MGTIEIRTNGKFRPVLYGFELTDSERRDFDYIDSDDFDGSTFVRYKGRLYDVGEFLRIPERSEDLAGWDGYAPDSYFSGTLIRFDPDDSERVVMGWYFS